MTPLARLPFRRVSLALAILGSGCIVHGYPCKDDFQGGGDGAGSDADDTDDGGDLLDDGGDGGGDDGGGLVGDDGGDGDTGDTGEDEVPEPPVFSLDPAEVVQGEAVTATLLADAVAWDHTAVVDLAVGPGLVLCSLEATPDAVTVVYGAWGDTPTGVVDVEVDLGDAGFVVLDGGVVVVPPGGIVTPDPEADPCATVD